MDINQLIQKIESENEKENIIRPAMTLPLLKFEAVTYTYDDLAPSPLTRSGYYTFENNQVKWNTDPDWETVNIPVSVSGKTICKYHGKITRDIVFIIVTGPLSATYVYVSGSDDSPLYDVTFAIPETTQAITASYYNNPEFTGFSMKVRKEQYTDITRYIKNWDDLDVKMARDGFSAVMMEISTPIELYDYAGGLVRQLIEDEGLYAELGINIYKRKAYNNDYGLMRKFEADFVTYASHDDYVEFELTNNSLHDVIKSGKSTKFDYPVSSLSESKKWDYTNRMPLMNTIPYTLPTDEVINFANQGLTTSRATMPLYYNENAELVQNDINAQLDFNSISASNRDFEGYPFFISEIIIQPIRLRMKFTVQLYIKRQEMVDTTLQLFIYDKYRSMVPGDTTEGYLWKQNKYITGSDQYITVTFDVNESLTFTYPTLQYTQYFVFGIRAIDESDNNSAIDIDFVTAKYTSFDIFALDWMSTAESINNIDLIRPARLLQRLLDSISPIKNKYTSRIEWDEAFAPMLCAAETVRQFPDPTLHGSLSDLMKWMEALGYSYTYEGDTLVYKRRNLLYKQDVIAIELSEGEVSQMSTEVNEDVVYSSVEVGYKKEDYGESANGKLEVNATFNYNTGYINPEGKVLSIISPYRSDSIGVEILLNKRGEKIKDNQSDNDVFALQMQENENNYVYSEENKIKVESESYDIYLYNGSLNPRFLAIRNQDIAGIITNRLMFASTDGGRKGTIGGKSIFTDLLLTGKLYEPFIYNFNVGSHLDIPDESVRDGIVFFGYKGVIRKGYIKNITKSIPEKEGEWELFMIK